MIVDSSALVAISLQEDGHEALAQKLWSSPTPVGVGTPTLVETGIVLSRRTGRDGRELVTTLMRVFDLEEVEFVADHWIEALRAHERFGRGRHPAALNFGDCLSYAVASVSNQPLLFVGDDFAKTDIEAA